jgi:hypothetical protein
LKFFIKLSNSSRSMVSFSIRFWAMALRIFLRELIIFSATS